MYGWIEYEGDWKVLKLMEIDEKSTQDNRVNCSVQKRAIGAHETAAMVNISEVIQKGPSTKGASKKNLSKWDFLDNVGLIYYQSEI